MKRNVVYLIFPHIGFFYGYLEGPLCKSLWYHGRVLKQSLIRGLASSLITCHITCLGHQHLQNRRYTNLYPFSTFQRSSLLYVTHSFHATHTWRKVELLNPLKSAYDGFLAEAINLPKFNASFTSSQKLFTNTQSQKTLPKKCSNLQS